MKIKYPKSYHFHYSEKLSKKDDRRHKNDDHFSNKEVVATIKLDGENSSLYNDGYHARSLDSKVDSEDRRWLDTLRTTKVAGKIPDNWRICGENMFYKHTCKYSNLENLFYIFSIWEENKCLHWDVVKEAAAKLELPVVPEVYRGPYDKELIMEAFSQYIKGSEDEVEGFVVRSVSEFQIEDFKYNLSKFVRHTFQIGNSHWRHAAKTLNEVKDKKNPWELL